MNLLTSRVTCSPRGSIARSTHGQQGPHTEVFHNYQYFTSAIQIYFKLVLRMFILFFAIPMQQFCSAINSGVSDITL